MATRYQFVDDSGETRLAGFLVPEPGGSVPSGAGGPVGVVTPSALGVLYLDSTNGGLYVAVGATDADWVQIGGAPDNMGTLTYGVEASANGYTDLISGHGKTCQVTDLAAINGTGNGFAWNPSAAADGSQDASLSVGASKFHAWAPDGSYAPPGGVIFPSADPMIVGAWWNDSGVLTISAAT